MIELSHVCKSYGLPHGRKVVLDNVSHIFREGVNMGILGLNGAGKSTLMRVMAGLTKPDAGSVKRNVSDEKLGYMAHATFLYPGLDAEENLLFWARAAGLDRPHERAKKALETVGLARHAHERAGIFSRGMAQRLNLARLLLASPSLILLDEPATGLDVSSRRMLMELMLKARSEGAAILWISHDTAGDSRHADRVLTLENRSLREEAGGLSC